MNEAPDFDKLRADRDAALKAIARALHVKLGGDADEVVTRW